MLEKTPEKTYYLTRDLNDPRGGKHFKGGSIQTSDPDEQKWIEEQLNAPMQTIPITKPPIPPSKDKSKEEPPY